MTDDWRKSGQISAVTIWPLFLQSSVNRKYKRNAQRRSLTMIPSVQEPVPSPDADAVSDGELVERFRKGEIAAFDTLFQRYNQPLCKYAVRLTDREHGYDLASEIFTIAFRQLPFLEEADRFKAWLYRI